MDVWEIQHFMDMLMALSFYDPVLTGLIVFTIRKCAKCHYEKYNLETRIVSSEWCIVQASIMKLVAEYKMETYS